jgi:hypothetical protein
MRSVVVRGVLYGVAAGAFVLAGQGHAFATAVSPEIDGGSMAAGFSVLGAGVLMLRSYLSRK